MEVNDYNPQNNATLSKSFVFCRFCLTFYLQFIEYCKILFITTQESEIPILLKRPLTVNPGDRVTVTKEFTPEYFRQPFVLLNVSLSQVRGFQPTSCESSRNCIDVLTSGANEDNRTNCAFSEYEDFLLDLYVQCRG